MWGFLKGNKDKIANQKEDGSLIVEVTNPANIEGLEIDEVGLKGSLAESLPKGISHNEYVLYEHTHESTDAQDVFETSAPCILQSFMFTTDNDRAFPQIYVYDANGVERLLRLIRSFVASPTSMHPLNFNSIGGENEDLKLIRYEDGEYVIILKKPIYCPTGLKLRSVGRAGEHTASNAISAQVVYYS